MTRRPVRILHTSDVHLGPGGREPAGRHHAPGCVCPVEVMGHLVKEHAVDLLLIAGDLFDHARIPADHVEDVFTRLEAIDAEVALLPGNHDVHDQTALYRRHRDVVDRTGIHFFDRLEGSSADLVGGAIRMWARAMDDHHPRYQPLVGAPAHPGDRWYVVAGHGHFNRTADDAHRSSPITVEHIDATGADYVALGHWHLTTDLAPLGVSTPAWYCGSPMFGHGSRHMLLVDLIPGRPVSVRPIDVLDHPASRC